MDAVADRTSKRLQDDLDARRRGLIVGFPSQSPPCARGVVRFIDGAFPARAPSAGPALRGFYFTSGVQQGTPMDRLLGRRQGLRRPSARPAQGRDAPTS